MSHDNYHNKRRNARAKAFLEYAKKLPFVKVKSDSEKTPNRITLKAMRNAEAGKVTRARNVKDLIEKLNL